MAVQKNWNPNLYIIVLGIAAKCLNCISKNVANNFCDEMGMEAQGEGKGRGSL